MKDRNPITIHGYGEHFDADQEALWKFRKNEDLARNAYDTGTVPVFGGFDREFFKRELNAQVVFDEATEKVLQERVIRDINAHSRYWEVPIITAAQGQRHHLVIQTGRYSFGMTDEDIANHVASINGDRLMDGVRRALQGRTIQMERLVFDKNGNIYLSSSRVIPEVYKARKVVQRILSIGIPTTNGEYSSTKQDPNPEKGRSLELVDYSGMAHVTVGRIGDYDDNLALNWVYNLANNDGLILKNPVKLTFADLQFGTSFDFVNRTAPQLFKTN